MTSDNFFAGIQSGRRSEEVFTELLSRPGLRIERIVSSGQTSPPGYWYDAPTGEWIMLLAGEAHLRVEGEAQVRMLKPGDWMDLPPHCRHRVEWTLPDQPTLWLAVHYSVSN